jgi:hypothetical protein
MWKPLIRCSIVGGLIVFLWAMISWMLLPMHKASMHHFADGQEVTSCITRYAPQDGIYVLPSWDDMNTEQKKTEPFIFVNVRRGVDSTNMTKSMVVGLITQIIGAGIITYILLRAKTMKYWGRVWHVTLLGALVAILGTLPAWNWWYFPTSWVFLEFFDLVIGWFLGGLVISKLIKN